MCVLEDAGEGRLCVRWGCGLSDSKNDEVVRNLSAVVGEIKNRVSLG